MGQIGVALWLPRTMALPAPTLSPLLSRRARATLRSWTCSPRCTPNSPSPALRRFPRPARLTKVLRRSSTPLSWSVATAWAPRTLWPLGCPKSLPPKRPLPWPAWRARWACSPSAWTVRPLPTRSRRPTSWAWR